MYAFLVRYSITIPCLANGNCIIYKLLGWGEVGSCHFIYLVLLEHSYLPTFTYSLASFLISNSGFTHGLAVFLTFNIWLCFLASAPICPFGHGISVADRNLPIGYSPTPPTWNIDCSHRQLLPRIASPSVYLELLIF